MLFFFQIIAAAKAQSAEGFDGGSVPTYDREHIGSFYIIVHIDHGGSTLADRIIERAGLLTEREMQDQVLDTMELERERGITIKSQMTRTVYRAADGKEYIFNLTDTPGRVDFNYEVPRALVACDGAVLVVDASQDIGAQTLANVYMALDHDLEVIPAINKVDLPSAEPDKIAVETEGIIDTEAESTPRISARTGLNVDQVLEAIVEQLPPPGGDEKALLQALIFDSLYDSYKGAIVFLHAKNGTVWKGGRVHMMAAGVEMDVAEISYSAPERFIPCDEFSAGMVGYLAANIKNVRDTRIGDTVTHVKNPAAGAFPDYKKVTLMVYCGLYPADAVQCQDLYGALEKLQLNDMSLTYELETSLALGFGFRCGFLGLLHLGIVQEGLEREYDLDFTTTAPDVVYCVCKTDDTMLELMNPSNLPDTAEIEHMGEPVVSAEIMLARRFIGPIMQLYQERRGLYLGTDYMEQDRATLRYELPLNEIICDFFDVLKSHSQDYASLDYELKGYRPSRLMKLDILVNRGTIDALSFIVFVDGAYERERKMCEKLMKGIPRRFFDIPIQAAIGSKTIARETVKAMRRDALIKCYDGDISRKKKLLEKQKEGKKRMRQIGSVEIPQRALMSVLRLSNE